MEIPRDAARVVVIFFRRHTMNAAMLIAALVMLCLYSSVMSVCTKKTSKACVYLIAYNSPLAFAFMILTCVLPLGMILASFFT